MDNQPILSRFLLESETEDGPDSSALALFFIFFFVGGFIVSTFLQHGIKVVRQSEVMIIERFGKYRRTLTPGIHLIVPFIDQPRKIDWRYVDVPAGKKMPVVKKISTDRIDMREHVIDFGRQKVITRDTVQIEIDALIYYQITDARIAVFNINNLPDAIEVLTQSTLRNIIARLTLDETFSSREHINSILLETIIRDAERWGVSIHRVEVMNILPPNDIKSVMEKQISAERERRSMVTKADGERESHIIKSRGQAAKLVLEAEGQKTATVQRAKGKAEAALMVANAEASGMNMLREVIGPNNKASVYLVTLQYLSALSFLSSRSGSKVVLLPSQEMDSVADLVNSAITNQSSK